MKKMIERFIYENKYNGLVSVYPNTVWFPPVLWTDNQNFCACRHAALLQPYYELQINMLLQLFFPQMTHSFLKYWGTRTQGPTTYHL